MLLLRFRKACLFLRRLRSFICKFFLSRHWNSSQVTNTLFCCLGLSSPALTTDNYGWFIFRPRLPAKATNARSLFRTLRRCYSATIITWSPPAWIHKVLYNFWRIQRFYQWGFIEIKISPISVYLSFIKRIFRWCIMEAGLIFSACIKSFGTTASDFGW